MFNFTAAKLCLCWITLPDNEKHTAELQQHHIAITSEQVGLWYTLNCAQVLDLYTQIQIYCTYTFLRQKGSLGFVIDWH